MSMYEWLTLGLSIVSALVLPVLVLVWKLAYKIHSNDLEHLAASEKTTYNTVLRIEAKLDRHLEDHAEGRFGR